MGVYIFQFRHGPWFKVGFHSGPTPWPRTCSYGGFDAIILPSPVEMLGRLKPEDLVLLHWWPEATLRHEKMVHVHFDGIGEWYPFHLLSAVKDWIANNWPGYSALQDLALGPRLALTAKDFGVEPFGQVPICEQRPTATEAAFYTSTMVEYFRGSGDGPNGHGSQGGECIMVWIELKHVKVVNKRLRSWMLKHAGFVHPKDGLETNIIAFPIGFSNRRLMEKACIMATLVPKKETDAAIISAVISTLEEAQRIAPVTCCPCLVIGIDKWHPHGVGRLNQCMATLAACPSGAEGGGGSSDYSRKEWRHNVKFAHWFQVMDPSGPGKDDPPSFTPLQVDMAQILYPMPKKKAQRTIDIFSRSK